MAQKLSYLSIQKNVHYAKIKVKNALKKTTKQYVNKNNLPLSTIAINDKKRH